MSEFGCKNISFDFHIHTVLGSPDAKQSVKDAIATAKLAGLDTIAITDHNSIDSLDEALALSKQMGVCVICGCEFSSTITGLGEDLDGCNIHVLGLGISNSKGLFEKIIKEARDNRRKWESQLKQLCEKTYGIKLKTSTYYEMREELVQLGLFQDKKAAKRWLNDGSHGIKLPSYIPISKIVSSIHEMGGIAIWAHPTRGENNRVLVSDDILRISKYLISKGLDGMELYHPDVISDYESFQTVKEIVEKHNLLVSVGSDRHNAFNAYGEHYFKAYDYLNNSKADFLIIKQKLLKAIK